MLEIKKNINQRVKYLILGMILTLLSFSGLLLYQAWVQNNLYRSGILLTQKILDIVQPALFEKKTQEIPSLLSDWIKRQDLVAYIIFDDNQKIVASVAKDYLKPFLIQMRSQNTSDDLELSDGPSPDGERLLYIYSKIRSSNVLVGEIYLSLSASRLNRIRYPIIGFGILCAFILLWLITASLYRHHLVISVLSRLRDRIKWPPFSLPLPLFAKKPFNREDEKAATRLETSELAGGKKIFKTLWWAKQFSTVTFLQIYRKILEQETFRRNKKQIGIYLMIWFSMNVGALYIYHTAVTGQYTAFYQKGLSLTYGLTDKIGLALLQEDFLRIGTAVGDYHREAQLISVAILDHQGKIVVHTDPGLINRSLPRLKNAETLKILDGTLFERGHLPDKGPTIYFSRDILFMDETIGKVYFNVSADALYGPIHRFGWVFICWFIFSALTLTAVIILTIRISKVKARQSQIKMEGLTRIGPYILQHKIGQGGMAELFLADCIREDGFRRTVAIKKIRPHLAEHPDFVNMFINEARLAALLHHPNIVQIIDFGNIENIYFMTMEYIGGKNIGEILTRFKTGLALDQAIFIILKIARGLEYSHSKKDDITGEPLNVIHCDVSLENILVSFQGEVKISDFGISRAAISNPRRVIQNGAIKGKLNYLSPEQVLGKPINHQTDIYSLGLVSYSILTGKIAQNFKNDFEALQAIPTRIIPPLKNIRPDFPPELNDIIMKCLEKDCSARYQRTQDLIDDLSALKAKLKMIYDEAHLAVFMTNHFVDESEKVFNNDFKKELDKIISFN